MCHNLRKLRLFWLLRGDRSVASSRLQGYLIHEELQKRHPKVNSEIILRPPFWLNADFWTQTQCQQLADLSSGRVIILQKMFSKPIELLPNMVRSRGGATVFVHCDLELDNRLPMLCDAVIVPSETLAEWYRSKNCKNVFVIPDPNEYTWAKPKTQSCLTHNLTIGWIGHKNNWETLIQLKNILRLPDFKDFKLNTISNHPDASIKWSPESVKDSLPKFDIAVLPVLDTFEARCKSSNRLTLFMGAGIPTIAGRLPAYDSIIKHGENGMSYNSVDDLKSALTYLRSPQKRQEIGARAYEDVSDSFSVCSITNRWHQALSTVAKHCIQDTHILRSENTETLSFQLDQAILMRKLAIKGNHKNMITSYNRQILNIAWQQLIKLRFREAIKAINHSR